MTDLVVILLCLASGILGGIAGGFTFVWFVFWASEDEHEPRRNRD